MSADPVREAAQAVLDADKAKLNYIMTGCGGAEAADRMEKAINALRTALAAPEGPAPTDEMARKDGSMSFEEAQDLARKHAKAEPESYYAEPFEPHLWVINAIVEASAHWYQRAVDERVRRAKEANSRAPEAPPPVEARQPPTLPCGHPVSLLLKSAETGETLYCELCDALTGRRDAEAMETELRSKLAEAEKTIRNLGQPLTDEQIVEVYECALSYSLSDEDRPSVILFSRALIRAALAAPAGAIQPHLDHQVGAPVTLSDAASEKEKQA